MNNYNFTETVEERVKQRIKETYFEHLSEDKKDLFREYLRFRFPDKLGTLVPVTINVLINSLSVNELKETLDWIRYNLVLTEEERVCEEIKKEIGI
jgi:hypothetical protein